MLSRKNFYISSKIFFTFISLIMLIPLTFLTIFFDFYSLRLLNREIASANRNALFLYQEQLEADLSQIETSMAQNWATNWNYQKLKYKLDPLDVHLNTLSIVNKAREQLALTECLGAVYIYSAPNDVCRCAYQDCYSYKELITMQNYVKSLDFESTPKSWFYDKVGDKYFLVRLIGFSNAYSVSLVDFDLVMAPSRLATQTHKTSSLVYLSNDGTVLNPSKTITENKLTFSPEDNNHIKKGQKENFFVVQDRLKYADITMLYLSPYQGSQFYLNATQMFAIIASVLTLLLIPFMCFLAIKIYFSPLRDAIATMENIRNGKLNSKLQETQFIREFSVFNSTFNRMMDEIHNLKIRTYENKLIIQKSQLQYFQIQLKPHFYLNCLKTLYGMIQQNKGNDAQQMILYVSQYIRYTFRDNSSLVPLQTELNQVQNYYKLQKLNTRDSSELTISADPAVSKFPVPMLCIQTFVENSFKHGRISSQPLNVHISVQLTETEEGNYLNISIQDNGTGFPDEFLQSFLQHTEDAVTGQHIGIHNLRQRLTLLYGDQAGLICMNNSSGALTEIILPIQEEPNTSSETKSSLLSNENLFSLS